MIRRLLERSQHEDGVLHLADSEPGDTQDLALVGHDVAEKTGMTRVDTETV
jgi:hypothetical protein